MLSAKIRIDNIYEEENKNMFISLQSTVFLLYVRLYYGGLTFNCVQFTNASNKDNIT